MGTMTASDNHQNVWSADDGKEKVCSVSILKPNIINDSFSSNDEPEKEGSSSEKKSDGGPVDEHPKTIENPADDSPKRKQRTPVEEASKKADLPPSAPWSLTDIKQPHPNDVMYGRGGGTNHHSGNKRYRKLVEERKMDYINSKRLDKPLVAFEIIKWWRGQSPSGRFLKQDEVTGLWNDVGDKKAREKTSQALREKAPQIRKEQEDLKHDLEEDQYGDGERCELRDQNDGFSSDRSRVVGFASSTKKIEKQPKKCVLMRDHSLGRDVIEPESGVSLEGFDWQQPVENVSPKSLPDPKEVWRRTNRHGTASEDLKEYPPLSDGANRDHSLGDNPLSGATINQPAEQRFIVGEDEVTRNHTRSKSYNRREEYNGMISRSSTFPPPPPMKQHAYPFDTDRAGDFSRTSSNTSSEQSGKSHYSSKRGGTDMRISPRDGGRNHTGGGNLRPSSTHGKNDRRSSPTHLKNNRRSSPTGRRVNFEHLERPSKDNRAVRGYSGQDEQYKNSIMTPVMTMYHPQENGSPKNYHSVEAEFVEGVDQCNVSYRYDNTNDNYRYPNTYNNNNTKEDYKHGEYPTQASHQHDAPDYNRNHSPREDSNQYGRSYHRHNSEDRHGRYHHVENEGSSHSQQPPPFQQYSGDGFDRRRRSPPHSDHHYSEPPYTVHEDRVSHPNPPNRGDRDPVSSHPNPPPPQSEYETAPHVYHPSMKSRNRYDSNPPPRQTDIVKPAKLNRDASIQRFIEQAFSSDDELEETALHPAMSEESQSAANTSYPSSAANGRQWETENSSFITSMSAVRVTPTEDQSFDQGKESRTNPPVTYPSSIDKSSKRNNRSSYSIGVSKPGHVKRATSNQNENEETKKETKMIKRPFLARDHSLASDGLNDTSLDASVSASVFDTEGDVTAPNPLRCGGFLPKTDKLKPESLRPLR